MYNNRLKRLRNQIDDVLNNYEYDINQKRQMVDYILKQSFIEVSFSETITHEAKAYLGNDRDKYLFRQARRAAAKIGEEMLNKAYIDDTSETNEIGVRTTYKVLLLR